MLNSNKVLLVGLLSVTSIYAQSSSAATPVAICPSNNFTSYADNEGNSWQILCGFDTNPGSFSSTNAASFAACIEACESTSKCAAVSYVGTTCYFKPGFSSLTTSKSVNSAFRINAQNYPVPAANSRYASSGCGSSLPAGIIAGASTVTMYITSGGQNRSYNIHVPSSYDSNKASPLIIAYHGRGEGPGNIEGESGLSGETWNPYGIAVYPQGFPEASSGYPQWQGDPATIGESPYIDDQTFTHDLLAYLNSHYCIDTSRTLATGFSNGGGFVGTLACNSTLSNQFSAFAISSGAEYTSNTSACTGVIPSVVLTNNLVQPVCSPGRKDVPILEFHGSADGTIPYTGGSRRGYCLPTIPHYVTDWSVRDGHSTANISSSVASGLVTKYEFGAADGVQGIVTHYMISGWGHAWASINAGAPIDATPIIMDFFYLYTNTNGNANASPSGSSAVESPAKSSSLQSISMSTSTAVSTSDLAHSSTIVSVTSGSTTSSSSTVASSDSPSSSASSIVATTSVTSSIGASSTPPSCPASNGTLYHDPYVGSGVNGLTYLIMCGYDIDVVQNRVVQTTTWQACFSVCDAQSDCTSFTWTGGNCYIKRVPAKYIYRGGDYVQASQSPARSNLATSTKSTPASSPTVSS